LRGLDIGANHTEVVFVLSSKRLYNLSRHDIRIRLEPLLSLRNLSVEHKSQILCALDLYSNNKIDFEDALSVAIMEHLEIKEIYTYDEDFDHIHGTTRTRLES
jgi:predicted nucleic-acid-binding protein